MCDSKDQNSFENGYAITPRENEIQVAPRLFGGFQGHETKKDKSRALQARAGLITKYV